jgi:hypothetical protein
MTHVLEKAFERLDDQRNGGREVGRLELDQQSKDEERMSRRGSCNTC